VGGGDGDVLEVDSLTLTVNLDRANQSSSLTILGRYTGQQFGRAGLALVSHPRNLTKFSQYTVQQHRTNQMK